MKLKFLHYELTFTSRWAVLRNLREQGKETVWYRSRDQRDRIEGYLKLAEQRPELFTNADTLRICTSRSAMLEFERNTGKKVGIVHNNSPYQYILSDMIEGKKPFAYLRVVPCSAEAGTVMLPRWTDDNGNEFFGILKMYRHATRSVHLELPRGHLDPGLTPAENAVKELGEEFGVRRENIRQLKQIGASYADSGLTSGMVRFYLVDLSGPLPEAALGHEGILAGKWLPRAEFLDLLRSGTIMDGMTMNAVLHFLLLQTPMDGSRDCPIS